MPRSPAAMARWRSRAKYASLNWVRSNGPLPATFGGRSLPGSGPAPRPGTAPPEAPAVGAAPALTPASASAGDAVAAPVRFVASWLIGPDGVSVGGISVAPPCPLSPFRFLLAAVFLLFLFFPLALSLLPFALPTPCFLALPLSLLPALLSAPRVTSPDAGSSSAPPAISSP